MKNIKRINEKELIKKAKKADKIALAQLLKMHEKFISSKVKRYSNSFINYSDLYNEAVVGFIKSIHKFDIDRDVTLLTYADWHIKSSIMRYLKREYKYKRHWSPSGSVYDLEIEEPKFFEDRPIDHTQNNLDFNTLLKQAIIIRPKLKHYIELKFLSETYYSRTEISKKLNVTIQRMQQYYETIVRLMKQRIS